MRMNPKNISPKRIRDLFEYDPETGILKRDGVPRVTEKIEVDGQGPFMTTHVIYCLMTGEWPTWTLKLINPSEGFKWMNIQYGAIPRRRGRIEGSRMWLRDRVKTEKSPMAVARWSRCDRCWKLWMRFNMGKYGKHRIPIAGFLDRREAFDLAEAMNTRFGVMCAGVKNDG